MSGMKGGLKPSRFLFSLKKRFPSSFPEMLFWAEKYANAKEAMSAKRSSATPQSDKKEKKKRKREEPSTGDRSNQVRGSARPPSPKFHNYAPLKSEYSSVPNTDGGKRSTSSSWTDDNSVRPKEPQQVLLLPPRSWPRHGWVSITQRWNRAPHPPRSSNSVRC